jgi:hypothetical protein
MCRRDGRLCIVLLPSHIIEKGEKAMHAMKRVVWGVSLVLAVILAFVTVRAASSSQEAEPRAAEASVGSGFTYQGQLHFDGVPVDADCDMDFRLFDGTGFLARPVGDPISRVVPITDGLFTVYLDFGSAAFRGSARWLDIAVQCPGEREPTALGRQELTAAPFALYALDAPWDGLPYAGVVIVAKSGGDYTSIQAAIDSIGDAAEDNPYLVWVAPGIYEERVRMAPYVHVQGAGQGATIITNSDYSVTLYLAAHTSLRDLTVTNEDSPYSYAYAILASASDNVTGTLVANVEAQALDVGTESHGCTLEGAETSVRLLDVTAHAQGGTYNYALDVLDGATAIVEKGSFHAQGGTYNYALEMLDGATAIVEGGSFTVADGSTLSYAIFTNGSETTLEATEVRAVAESTTGGNRGLYNSGRATLRGGLYAAHGNSTAYGIHNTGSEAVLDAYSVAAEASGSLQTRGLANEDGGSAALHGGSFTARDGSPTAGLYQSATSSALVANGISAIGEDAGTLNYGVQHGGGSCTITNSVLEGAYFSAYTNGGTLRLSHTRLLGPVGGSPTCLGVSTDTDFYAEECP